MKDKGEAEVGVGFCAYHLEVLWEGAVAQGEQRALEFGKCRVTSATDFMF